MDGVPGPEAVVEGPAQSVHTVDVAKICDQEAEEENAPDAEIGGGTEDERFIEGEDEV